MAKKCFPSRARALVIMIERWIIKHLRSKRREKVLMAAVVRFQKWDRKWDADLSFMMAPTAEQL